MSDVNVTTWLATSVASLKDQRGGDLDSYFRSYAILHHLISKIKDSQQFSERQRELLAMIDNQLERIGKEATE